MSNRKYTQQLIQWDAVPKVEDERFIPIYSAVPGATFELAIVSDQLVTVVTHYMHRRTFPCVGEANSCEGCAAHRQARVKGYFGCWEKQFNRLVMAELTTEAMSRSNVPLAPRASGFRGRVIKLWRIGKGENGAVRCAFHDVKEPLELPDEFDVRAALTRIWNGKHRPK